MGDKGMSDDELIKRIMGLKMKIKSEADGSLNAGLEYLDETLGNQPKANSIVDVDVGEDSFTILTDEKDVRCTCSTKGALPVTIVANQETWASLEGEDEDEPYTAELELTDDVQVINNGVEDLTDSVTLEWPAGEKGSAGTDMTKPPVNEKGVTYYDDAKTRVKGKSSTAASSVPITGVSAAITGISGGLTGVNVSLGVLDHVIRGGQFSMNAFSVTCNGTELECATRKEAIWAACTSAIPFFGLIGLSKNSRKAVESET